MPRKLVLTVPGKNGQPVPPGVWKTLDIQDVPLEKAVSFAPIAGDKWRLFKANHETIFKKINVVIVGGTDVTFTIRHDLDYSAAGTELITGGTLTSNTTTGDDIILFDSAIVPFDSHVWLEIVLVTGSVTEFSLLINLE